MPVQPIIPPEWGWAYDIAVGQSWPQADEDALRRVAQAWTDAMEALLTVADGGNAAAANVNYSVQSVSSDEFGNYWSQYVSGDNSVLGQLAQQCENLATQSLAFAEQTEFTKLSIDIQLILLFIQLVIDLVMAFVTFGASTSEGVLAAFITRLTVRGFLTELVKAVLMAVLPDVITQTIMLAEGHRSSFDVGETLQAAQMGVIGGLVGYGVGAGLGKLGAAEFFGSVAGRFLREDAGKFAGGVANAAVHGALTNVGTNLVAGTVDSAENQIHAAVDPFYAQELRQQTQDQGYADQKSGENPLIAALNGAFTGALFHSVHEGSFALAGHTFDAVPLTLTDSQGNTQQFTALPIRDGSGSNYALFDHNSQLIGKGTIGDDGAFTVTPNSGSQYEAQVVKLGDQQFTPSGTPPVTPDTSTQLASSSPAESPLAEPQIPPDRLGQQPVTPPVPQSPDVPRTVPGVPPAEVAVSPDVTPVTGQSVTPPGQESVPAAPAGAESHPPAAADGQPAPAGGPAGGQTVAQQGAVSTGPADVTGSTELSSVPVQPDSPVPDATTGMASGAPGAAAQAWTRAGAAGGEAASDRAEWFPLGADRPESGQQPRQPGVGGGTGPAQRDITPRQAADIERVPTVMLSSDRPLVFTDTGEAMAYAERVWGDAIGRLTPEQKAALMAYTGEAIVGSGDPPSYHSINRYLRGRIPATPEILDSIARIDEALRLQPVPETVVVNRTTNAHAFTLPDGTTVENPADLPGLVGSRQDSPRYLSTHFGAYHPGGEEVALHLAVPDGTPALYVGTMSVDPSQHELLLGRGLSFQIDRVWSEPTGLGGDTWHVQAHVLPEHPAEAPAYYRVVADRELAGPLPTPEELGAYVGMMHAAAMGGGNELAIAFKAGDAAEPDSPGHLIVIEGTRDGVGLPSGLRDYRLIWHTQQGEGPSEADVSAAANAGHPYELVTEHYTDPETGRTFTRTRLFDQEGTEIRYPEGAVRGHPLLRLIDQVVDHLPTGPPRPEAGAQQHNSPEFTGLTGRRIWREGDHPSAALLAGEFGIPEQNQRRIQELVDRYRIAIDLRPSNPESASWLERGGVPKPEAIKAKTINAYDAMLAPDEATRVALAANVGAVGFFAPAEPVEAPVLDAGGHPTHPQLVRTTETDAVWAALEKRYASLMREYQANHEALSHLAEEGFFHVVDGVVYPYRAEIVNRLDIQLAPDDETRAVLEGSLRTAAYFRPAEPVQTPRLDANDQPTHPQLVRTGESQGEWAALQKRYVQRLAEYLQVTDDGRGVVKFTLGPLQVPAGMPAVDPMLGPPVTGDHDMLNIRGLNDLQLPRMLTVTNTDTGASVRMFEFRDADGHLSWRALAPEGTALKVTDFDTGQSRLMSEIVDSLGNRTLQDYRPNPDVWFERLAYEPGREKWDIPPMPAESGDAIAGGMGIMHGATAYWTPKSDQEIRIYGDIMRDFGRDGDILIRFQADQPPMLVHSDTPVISGLIGAPDIVGLIEGPHHNSILEALTGHRPADLGELPAPPQHPEWAGKIHAGNGCLIIGDDPELAAGGAQPTPGGALLVKAHGRGGDVFLGPDSREPVDVSDPAFTALLEAAGLRPGQPIVLASCDAGLDRGAADQLAARFPGTIVIAADTAVWDDHHGGLFAAGETVVDGMPRPALVADEDGTYHPDGSWKAHRSGMESTPLPESDPRVPPVPEQLNPVGDYARLQGARQGGYRGELFGPRTPDSSLAQVTDAFARRDPAAVITADPARAGQWLLGAVDPARLPPDVRQDPLNEALRTYAEGLLDKVSQLVTFRPFTDALARQERQQEAIAQLDEAVAKKATAVAGLQAKFDELKRQDPGQTEEQRRAAILRVNQGRQELEKAKSELKSLRQQFTNAVNHPNNAVKVHLDVHSIPVDGDWDKAWVRFHSGDGDYPSIVERLTGLRDRYRATVPDFEQRYGLAVLDLAAVPAGPSRIPQSLLDLAGRLYGPGEVTRFLQDPDPLKWATAGTDSAGAFLHDAAAIMALQVQVEGRRNPAALVTNLANWAMVATGKITIHDALGYLNVMGPAGSVRVGRASAGFGDPDGPDTGESVAEMQMRQRQILALYAIAAGEVPLAEDASGVAALNAFFAQGDAVQKEMAALVQRLGW